MTTEEAKATLLAWETQRRNAGKKAPASPQRPNCLSLAQVEKETGIPRNRYDRDGKELRRWLMGIVERLGGIEVEWDRSQFEQKGVHLHLVRGLCSEHYQRRCNDLATPYRNVRPILERLFHILFNRADAKDGAVPARPALVAFREAIARGEVVKGESFLPYVETALELLAKEEKRTGLPEAFPQRLDHVVRLAGLSRTKAAQRIGVVPATFNSWCSGAKAPDQSFFPAISRLEALLDLEPETLTSVIRKGVMSAGRFRSELFPYHLRGDTHAAFRSEVGRQMPKNFFELPLNAQIDLIDEKIRTLEAAALKKRAWYEIRQDSYALDPFPPELKKEWLELLKFKSGQLVLRDDQDRPMFAAKHWNTSDTIRTNLARIAGYLGYLVKHAPDEMRREPDRLTLLDLCDHSAMLAFLRWKAERQAPYRDGEHRITKTDLDLITTAAALLSPDDGFLRYHPRYREPLLLLRGRFGLPPVLGNTREEQDYRATQDRHVICNRLWADLKAIEGGYRYRTSSSKEHQSRLNIVLDRERPLEDLYGFIQDKQTQLQNMKQDTAGYYRGLRACALLHLLAQHPLRRSTVVRLDYRYDNTGNLRCIDDQWELDIPTAWFKNANSERFEGLDRVTLPLEDVHGAHEIFKLYIGHARDELLGGTRSNALFVSTPKNPRYSRQGLDNLFRGMTASFVSTLLPDEPNSKTLSVHDVRDVVATSVIKVSGSFELAADAILDAPSTVRRAYAQWHHKDRERERKAALERARGLTARTSTRESGNDLPPELPPDGAED